MIGIYNIEKDMVRRLSKSMDIYEFTKDDIQFPKIDGLIIDYIDSTHYKEWVYQAALIEKYIKDTKIIIFDRYFSVTDKEFQWLKKFNIVFFEPAINNRREFQYLPYWIDTEMDINYIHKEKNIHMAYDCPNIEDKIKYFEKYYKQYAMLFPDKKVCYSTEVLNEKKRKGYENSNLKSYKFIDYNKVWYTILIDSKQNYESGYLDQRVFDVMSHGCVPMLPYEHKYFHPMFSGLVINSIEDIDYFTSVPDIGYELIEGVLNGVKEYYPEFLIDNVAEVLINCVRGKL